MGIDTIQGHCPLPWLCRVHPVPFWCALAAAAGSISSQMDTSEALDLHGAGTVSLEEFCFLDHWAHKRLKKPLPTAPVRGTQNCAGRLPKGDFIGTSSSLPIL